MKALVGRNSKLRDEGLIPVGGIKSVGRHGGSRATVRAEGTQLSAGFSIGYHAQ